MSKQKELQKLSIVFEETGKDGGNGFNVYLDGHTRDITHVNEKDLSPAEFWASRSFAIVIDAIKKSGALKNEFRRPNGGIKQ